MNPKIKPLTIRDLIHKRLSFEDPEKPTPAVAYNVRQLIMIAESLNDYVLC